MKLTREDFDARYRSGRLHIAFIGMSNIGKSYTAERLSESHNFELIEVDRIIWESLGEGSMADFARWQGQPYSDGYAEREARSIRIENDATKTALTRLGGNALLDTTGSVIYAHDDVLADLSARCLVVHIRADATDIARLQDDYFDTPKPLIWFGHFKADPDKSDRQNIRDCYPALLASRQTRYRALADISLPSQFILDPNTSMDDVMDAMRAQLP